MAGAAVGFVHAFRPRVPSPVSVPAESRAVPHKRGADVPEAVTRLELAEALDRAATRMRGEMDSRFSAQDDAIEALREMTSHTGELIEQLLEKLGAAHSDGIDIHSEPTIAELGLRI